MAVVGIELETLVSESDALTTRPFYFFYCRSICIIDDGASRRRTRNTRRPRQNLLKTISIFKRYTIPIFSLSKFLELLCLLGFKN